MLFTLQQVQGWVGDFFWPFMRIAMVFTVAPIFGGRLVPVKVRLITALAITSLIVPGLPPAPALDPLSGAGLLITVQQLAIGLIMGFLLQLVFAAMLVGGQTIAMGMGLGFASMVDPQNGVQVPVVGQYYLTMATLLFLAMDGHLALIGVIALSFESLPIGSGMVGSNDFWVVATWGAKMFAGGVLVAMPAVISLLLVNLTFGVITRAAPQLNIFGVGFPITMTLGFIVMMFTTPTLFPLLADMTTEALGAMRLLGQPEMGS